MLLTISSAGFYACKKQVPEMADANKKLSLENKIERVNEADLIIKDVDYQNYISDFKKIILKDKDLESIKKFMKLKSLTKSESDEFAKAMGFLSNADFEEFSKLQSARLKNVNNKFGLLTNSKLSLTSLVEETLSTQQSKFSQGKVMVAPSPGDGGGGPIGSKCAEKFASCMAISTAAAIVGHLTCTAIDVATAGFGALLCHGAVIIANSAANNSCLISYDECNSIPS